MLRPHQSGTAGRDGTARDGAGRQITAAFMAISERPHQSDILPLCSEIYIIWGVALNFMVGDRRRTLATLRYKFIHLWINVIWSVASRGGCGESGPHRVTPSDGVTPNAKNFFCQQETLYTQDSGQRKLLSFKRKSKKEKKKVIRFLRAGQGCPKMADLLANERLKKDHRDPQKMFDDLFLLKLTFWRTLVRHERFWSPFLSGGEAPGPWLTLPMPKSRAGRKRKRQ